MRSSWQKYLDVNVPRYTSYPSALQFTTDVGPDAYGRALQGLTSDEPVSLYIHIPFCKQLCWYCGCNMRVENRPERITAYVDDLIDELAIIGGRVDGRGTLSQVHFGGGTPNTLSDDDLSRIMAAIEHGFGPLRGIPVAMEIDPRLAVAGQPARLAAAGVTRFSIGVQDFDPAVQEAINRVQPFDMVARCMSELRDAGADDISLDLLYGLPSQTICTFRRTVEQVIALAPDRVSLFGYAHMPSRLRHQRLMDEDTMPSRAVRPVLSETAAVALEAAGFERIGFDHFAKPGTAIAIAARDQRLNRNFQGFTEDQAQVVIGAGISAISTVHGVVAQNCKSPRTYHDMIACGDLPIERGLVTTLEEEDLGDWLKRLLCDMRGSLAQYCDVVGASREECDRLLERLKPLVRDGILTITGDTIAIHEDAKPLARVVAAAFDPYVQGDTQFASPAV